MVGRAFVYSFFDLLGQILRYLDAHYVKKYFDLTLFLNVDKQATLRLIDVECDEGVSL